MELWDPMPCHRSLTIVSACAFRGLARILDERLVLCDRTTNRPIAPVRCRSALSRFPCRPVGPRNALASCECESQNRDCEGARADQDGRGLLQANLVSGRRLEKMRQTGERHCGGQMVLQPRSPSTPLISRKWMGAGRVPNGGQISRIHRLDGNG